MSGLYVRNRRLDQAIAILERGLEFEQYNAILLNDLGLCFLLRGSYERASTEFSRAVESAPYEARFIANRALAAGMLGHYEEAFELYSQIMPEREAHFNLGILCEARDDHDRAAREHELADTLAVGNETAPEARPFDERADRQ